MKQWQPLTRGEFAGGADLIELDQDGVISMPNQANPARQAKKNVQMIDFQLCRG
jgi:hypothetical protein